MEESHKENLLVAKVLYESRIKAKKSQEYMAAELRVAKGTIINWEKGLSAPKFDQLLEWFNILGSNIHRPLMQLIFPDIYLSMQASSTDELILEAVLTFISTLPVEGQRQVAYVLLGEHGSSPTSLLQLFTAYLHLPMRQRIAIAQSIREDYEICEKRNELICSDNIKPNLDYLDKAIHLGKEAAINNEYGYSHKQ